ncbi:CpsB/CapC family capsule biosynthesis tyrosine phosphatase [Flavobacterium ovatum]|uniref:tyrosine-protein phosphatase n=1 Tax=Flavobacterium ovatum TaxID=1928857 RepID=UPI003450A4C9
MLFFSKKKTVLKDLIPDNHIDIHSHLLPGIDDGAQNFEETLSMTRALQSFGVTQFITTPHIIQHVWDNTHEQIQAKRDTTVLELAKNDIQIPFKAAAEYLMDDQFVKLFESHDLLTLKDNYVLVEMSYINAPVQLYSILFDLQIAGYIPVLAHPERYLFYHNNPDEFKKLKKAGCKLQLNLLAVTGYYGKEVTAIAEDLLKKGLYDFVGSDTHHKNHIAAFDVRIKIKDDAPLKEIIANNQFFKVDL